MAVKDPHMKQVVRAAKYARDSMADQGEVRWFGGGTFTLRWGGNHLLLEDETETLIAGPIGEFADMEIENG